MLFLLRIRVKGIGYLNNFSDVVTLQLKRQLLIPIAARHVDTDDLYFRILIIRRFNPFGIAPKKIDID